MTSETDKELEMAVAKAVSEIAPPERPAFRAITTPQPVSLTDQWTKLEKIQSELSARIRRERMMALAEYERLVVETNNDFDRRVDDAMTKLDTDRRTALRNLSDRTSQRLGEIELLMKRMSAT